MPGGRSLADIPKDVLEILPVGIVRMFTKEEFVRILRQLPAFTFASQPAFLDQMVVFKEPDKSTGQYPRHGDLIEIILAPDFKGLGGAASFFNLMECFLQPYINLGIAAGASQ